MQILITRNGKQKRIDVPEDAFDKLAVLKIFETPETIVNISGYRFKMSEIEPWPPAENTKMF